MVRAEGQPRVEAAVARELTGRLLERRRHGGGSAADLGSQGRDPVHSFGAQFPSVTSASHLSGAPGSVPADRALADAAAKRAPAKQALMSFGSEGKAVQATLPAREQAPESTLEPSEQKASEPALVSNNSALES